MPNAALAASAPAMPDHIGPAGLEVIQAFESCMKKIGAGRFTTYRDSVGVLTIGWGHTNHHLPRFKEGTVWSQAECDSALAGDMTVFERHVHAHCRVALSQNELDALVSWSFNTGGPPSATLWTKLNAGNKRAIPSELAKWNRGGGRVIAGLTRRRRAEGLLFAGDVKGALAVAHS